MEKKTSPLAYVFILLGVLLILFPLYLTIITAFKSQAEINKSFFALPESFYLGNFTEILTRSEYPRTILNTVFITLFGLAGLVVVVPMVSYSIARNMDSCRYYKFLYYFMLVGIFVPFQVKMLPLVKIMSMLNMLSVPGITVVYIASSVCEGLFLYVAYIKSLPLDLEEAATIDGAGTARAYASIVFPLLKPMTTTVIIKNGLWLWNDFFLPQLVLNKSSENWTLTLFQYNFKTQLTVNYPLTFAAFILSMLPVMVLYVFLQKNIIGGLTSGAVKG